MEGALAAGQGDCRKEQRSKCDLLFFLKKKVLLWVLMEHVMSDLQKDVTLRTDNDVKKARKRHRNFKRRERKDEGERERK